MDVSQKLPSLSLMQSIVVVVLAIVVCVTLTVFLMRLMWRVMLRVVFPSIVWSALAAVCALLLVFALDTAGVARLH